MTESHENNHDDAERAEAPPPADVVESHTIETQAAHAADEPQVGAHEQAHEQAHAGERESARDVAIAADSTEILEHAESGTATTQPGTASSPHVVDEAHASLDAESTVNLSGDALADFPLRDDAAPEAPPADGAEVGEALFEAESDNVDAGDGAEDEEPVAATSNAVTRAHLKGLLESLVFVSDKPIKSNELAKAASAPSKEVKELLAELKTEYATRGIQLDEVAGGWIFRTNAQYAPFVRDLTKQKPVKLTRAQVETLAILAYRQPITRPEIDDIRGVDCGPVLKLMLERDLIKILGKKDEPGRPLLYGTTTQFLEFFGLKSLKDLPTLREFTELNEDSRRVVERELGEVIDVQPSIASASSFPSAPPPAMTDEMNEVTHSEARADDSKTDPPPDDEPDTDARIVAAVPIAADADETDDEAVEARDEEPTAESPIAGEDEGSPDEDADDERDDVAESEDASDEIARDTETPPAARKPGPWEMAADGDEEEEDDEDDEDDDEDDDEWDDEDDEDDDEEDDSDE